MKNINYKEWCIQNKLDSLLGIDITSIGEVGKKMEKQIYENVDPTNNTPFPAELDDLIRLHYITRKRKVTTILEFEVGKSTIVLADALKKNKEDYGSFIKENIRRANPFEIHSIDNSSKWLDVYKSELPDKFYGIVNFCFSEVEMTTFNDRACTMYRKLPNICPDLIYLDGPDLHSVVNDKRGISTKSVDRLPMSADILFIEPFLLPGTFIIVDGRSANARFLKNNFQRNWEYNYYRDNDIHTFELVEEPLGKINERQLLFCLGEDSKKYFNK